MSDHHTIEEHMSPSVIRDPAFRRVTVGRVSEEIAEQIKRAIRGGQLVPGDRLPPERELTRRFGVSRMSVRDALRTLEAAGLIEVRVGARGGAYVRAPGSEVVEEDIANMLMLASIPPRDVTEARMIIEVGIVPLVVERADDADLELLARICEESREALRAGRYSAELSARFHIAFARASHNAAIQVLIESLRGPLVTSLERAREISSTVGASGVREHVALFRAVRRRDVDGAIDIMTRHLGRTARRLARAIERR